MKSEISKKSDRETGRFIGTLLMVLLLIAAVTTISVTLGAIHVSPDEIVKILANKTSGKDIFAVSWEQKISSGISVFRGLSWHLLWEQACLFAVC